MLEIHELKLSKLVSKFKLKLEKFIFLELVMCSKLKFSCSMKLKLDEMRAHSSTTQHIPI